MPYATERTCQGPHCGLWFSATRSDARYCSPGCRQRAHRERAHIRNEGPVTAKPVKPDLDRPVPVAHRDWEEARFWTFSDPWSDHPTASMPTRLADDTALTLREYVFGVACIGRVLERDDDAYPYDMFSPLPDGLPNDITPRLAGAPGILARPRPGPRPRAAGAAGAAQPREPRPEFTDPRLRPLVGE
jgi:hypothetical protein